jgi:hypothetical protein
LFEESSFFLLGQSVMKWVVSPHSKKPLGDLLLLTELVQGAELSHQQSDIIVRGALVLS